MNLLLLLMIGLALAACRTVLIEAAQQPTLQTGSPLKELPPIRIHVAEFADLRGFPREFVGRMKNFTYEIDSSVGHIVRVAVERELQRNGHLSVANTDASPAEIYLQGSVHRYLLSTEENVMLVTVTGQVGIEIVAKSASQKRDIFNKRYAGAYSMSGMFIPYREPVKVLNEALLNMIKDFTGDREFIAFLRRAVVER
jgi:hypothetical protein